MSFSPRNVHDEGLGETLVFLGERETDALSLRPDLFGERGAGALSLHGGRGDALAARDEVITVHVAEPSAKDVRAASTVGRDVENQNDTR